MPANFDPSVPCDIDLKIMNKHKFAIDPNSKEALDESMKQLAAHNAKMKKV